jgi:hypothetical protein
MYLIVIPSTVFPAAMTIKREVSYDGPSAQPVFNQGNQSAGMGQKKGMTLEIHHELAKLLDRAERNYG